VIAHGRYLAILTALFSALWLELAFKPYDRADWALENVLVLAFAAALALSHRRFVLSRLSCSLIFVPAARTVAARGPGEGVLVLLPATGRSAVAPLLRSR
jgi:hypothetical protein